MEFYIGAMFIIILFGILSIILLDEKKSKKIGLIISGIILLSALSLLLNLFLSGAVSYKENYGLYISILNIMLQFQLNAISVALIVMVSIVAFAAILAGNIEKINSKGKNALVLLFELSAIALFASANLFLFYIFWDVGVITLFFMLYLYGSANRKRAATKFFIYEFAASLLLLLAIIILYYSIQPHTFNINAIIQNASSIPKNTQELIFLLFFLAFVINMPIFPFHSWLPDAYTEASTQGSMLLSSTLAKFGGYGMLLLFLILPISHLPKLAFGIFILGLISVFYAAFTLMSQRDIKRVIAYSSIVEMGIILVGIASLNQLGIEGAAFAMFAHGLIISLMFLVAGSIGHIFLNRDIKLLSGIAKNTLSSAYTFMFGIFAIAGVPLTVGFIGDILIFSSAFSTYSIIGLLPLFALIILVGFLYYINSKTVFNTGEYSKEINYIGIEQKAGYIFLITAIFVFGIMPFLILNLFSTLSF
ncbi:MAG: complex I subunit 4 family protein [Candidatus Micrarchaeia archaeon]